MYIGLDTLVVSELK